MDEIIQFVPRTIDTFADPIYFSVTFAPFDHLTVDAKKAEEFKELIEDVNLEGRQPVYVGMQTRFKTRKAGEKIIDLVRRRKKQLRVEKIADEDDAVAESLEPVSAQERDRFYGKKSKSAEKTFERFSSTTVQTVDNDTLSLRDFYGYLQSGFVPWNILTLSARQIEEIPQDGVANQFKNLKLC